jgi:hypothetical protein
MPRLKKSITNGIIGANRTLRESSNSAPQVVIECSITNYKYLEKTEEKKLFMVKDKGRFKIITLLLEASFKVVRVARPRDDIVLFADNVSLPYKEEFQEGVQSALSKIEVEDRQMNLVIKAILAKLTNTEETIKVRLMGKGDLGRYARLAQSGQWLQYVDSITTLAAGKVNKAQQGEFGGDTEYNLSIAYEAKAYEFMWKNYAKADDYFEQAETHIQSAQKLDPREKEYVNAQARQLKGREYFETIKKRFDKPPYAENVAIQPGPPPKPGAQADTITNDDVLKMLKDEVPEEIIVNSIKNAKQRRFDTSATGIGRLHKAGASVELIKLMQETPPPAPPGRRRK